MTQTYEVEIATYVYMTVPVTADSAEQARELADKASPAGPWSSSRRPGARRVRRCA